MSSFLFLLRLQLNRHYAIITFVIECESSLAVLFVGFIVWVIYDLPEISLDQVFSTVSLTRNIADGYVD